VCHHHLFGGCLKIELRRANVVHESLVKPGSSQKRLTGDLRLRLE
jgi:hypothetical protein